jgi:hypothetical protein
VSVYRVRTGTGHNFRLLHPSGRVWRIVNDTVAKTPAVGGVRLDGGEFPPSRLDAPHTANPWRYALRAPIRQQAELNRRKYTSDDPFEQPLNLTDFAFGNHRAQPAWLRPGKCFPAFAHLRAGKRAAGGGEMPPVGTWHISGDRWSTAQIQCSACGGPMPEGRRKFCSDPCAHEGDLQRRRKRPRDNGKWWRPTRGELPDNCLLNWGCATLPKDVIESLLLIMAETYV